MKALSTITRSSTVAASVLLLTAGVTYAGVGDQLQKLLSSNMKLNARFGSSVSISGTTAIVGTPGDDAGGDVFNSGSAYLFDTVTGLQVARLLPSDGSFVDLFGSSVSISGTTAIVGAPGDDDNSNNSGSAYLFDTTTGLQLAKLLASDPGAGDSFGGSVSISGTTAIVGARHQNPFSSHDSGSAYLFDTVTGLQVAKLMGINAGSDDDFGTSVWISGTTAIVGATRDDDSGPFSGAAYLFDAVTGLQIARLLPSDGETGDAFGTSVSIIGTTAIVGAPGDDDNDTNSGAAYLFDTVTGLQIAKLSPSDGALGDGFGGSVSISSNSTAIIGAPGDDDNGSASGSAYVFDTVTGLQIAKLLPNDGATGDIFGASIAVSGSTAILGAFADDDNGSDSGSAYLFQTGPPALASDVSFLSLGMGGAQVLTLEGGSGRAGWAYFVLGSVTGTTPGIDFGGDVLLPLNFDLYMNLTLSKPGFGAFGAFRGTLDGTGHAVATFSVPSLTDPTLAGMTINHAYLAASVLGFPEFASNSVPVRFSL